MHGSIFFILVIVNITFGSFIVFVECSGSFEFELGRESRWWWWWL